MQDLEINSLLEEAGYRYDPTSGRYIELSESDEPLDYATEEIADQLEIPVDDLLRWESEQNNESR